MADKEDGLERQHDGRGEDGLGAAVRRTWWVSATLCDKKSNLSGATGGVSISNRWWTYYKKNNSNQKHNWIVTPVVRASDKHEVAISTPISSSLVFCFKEN
jgi:hypothetical protein